MPALSYLKSFLDKQNNLLSWSTEELVELETLILNAIYEEFDSKNMLCRLYITCNNYTPSKKVLSILEENEFKIGENGGILYLEWSYGLLTGQDN